MLDREKIRQDVQLLKKVEDLEARIDLKIGLWITSSDAEKKKQWCEEISGLSRQYYALTGEFYRRKHPKRYKFGNGK